MFEIFTGKPEAVEMKLNQFTDGGSIKTIKSIHMTSRADGSIVVLVHYGF